MNIGVCGSGTIASWVSDILNQLNDERIVLYGVASAFEEQLKTFAAKYGYKKTYTSYEAMMADPDIDVIYVAIPNHLHMEVTMKAIEAGKNVIVEKPFAVNYAQAQKMIGAAKEKGVFITEALWPSFLPSRKIIDDIIASGKIGEVTGGKLISVNNVMFLERVKKLETGGGALLDMGPYVLGRMTNHFGWDIKGVTGHFEKLDTGVDSRDYYTVEYNNGVKVECVSTIDSPEEEREEYGEICGTKGSIWFNVISNPDVIEVRDLDGNVIEKPELPKLIQNTEIPFVRGYEHEWLGFEKAIREGKQQTDEAPWAQTLAISKVMTELRAQAGVVFPFE
ncbi:MAG: Gfo/Idh/MocA family oxidoreductase [Lachnospiraceae bacterium]|nr:Gfo/Idh/MocA family oxidoreductase [Lachnospiraceae bacterium]